MLKRLLFLLMLTAGLPLLADAPGPQEPMTPDQAAGAKYFQSFTTRPDSTDGSEKCFAVDSEGKFYFNTDPEYVCKANYPIRPQYLVPIVPISKVFNAGPKNDRVLYTDRYKELEAGVQVDLPGAGGHGVEATGQTYIYRSADGTNWFFKIDRSKTPPQVVISDYRVNRIDDQGKIRADMHFGLGAYRVTIDHLNELQKIPLPTVAVPVPVPAPLPEAAKAAPPPQIIYVPVEKAGKNTSCPNMAAANGKDVNSINEERFCDDTFVTCILEFRCNLHVNSGCDAKQCMDQYNGLGQDVRDAFQKLKKAATVLYNAGVALTAAQNAHSKCQDDAKLPETSAALKAAEDRRNKARAAHDAALKLFNNLVQGKFGSEAIPTQCIKKDLKNFSKNYEYVMAVISRYAFKSAQCGPETAAPANGGGGSAADRLGVGAGSGDRGRQPQSMEINGKKNMNKLKKY